MKRSWLKSSPQDQAEMYQTIETIPNPLARWLMKALAAVVVIIGRTFWWWLIGAFLMLALIGFLASGSLDSWFS